MIAAATYSLHCRQQGRERPDGSGFTRPSIAKNQNAANTGIYGCKDQRLFHFVLGNDRREGKCLSHNIVSKPFYAYVVLLPVHSRPLYLR